MNYILPFILFCFFSCKKQDSEFNNKIEIANIKKEAKVSSFDLKYQTGYLFVNINYIYRNGTKFSILDKEGKDIIVFNNRKVYLNQKAYEIIEDEGIYSHYINVESYFPEYGLFIIKATKKRNCYEVEVNNSIAIIDNHRFSNLLTFKSVEKYVLEGYPNPSKKNPLRFEPFEDSDIIPNFLDFTYLSLEIKGDWLKVKDDKDCYIGEEPSEKDIIGWIRWRKDGKIIIDIRHIC